MFLDDFPLCPRDPHPEKQNLHFHCRLAVSEKGLSSSVRFLSFLLRMLRDRESPSFESPLASFDSPVLLQRFFNRQTITHVNVFMTTHICTFIHINLLAQHCSVDVIHICNCELRELLSIIMGTKLKDPQAGPLPKPFGKFSVALFVSICSRTVCRTSFCRALGPRSSLRPSQGNWILKNFQIGSNSLHASMRKPCGKSSGNFTRKVLRKLYAESPAESPAETVHKVENL